MATTIIQNKDLQLDITAAGKQQAKLLRSGAADLRDQASKKVEAGTSPRDPKLKKVLLEAARWDNAASVIEIQAGTSLFEPGRR